MPDLLLELFSEEIPARMQARARDDLKRMVTEGLVEAGLSYASAGAFSTPRRLALSVEGVLAASPTTREERKGPRADAPAAAVEGFLRSTGLTRDRLELREAGKAQVYFGVIERPGRPAAEIVAEVVERVVRTFPWPKSMRWGTGTLRWVRPLRRILCLLSDEAGATVVPLSVDHLTGGDVTEGHRFMAPKPFSVTSFDDYRAKLKRAFVVLDSAEREAAIWQDVRNQAFAQGLEPVPDAGLLAEVAGLVEWPVVLCGKIDPRFLHLPPEVLQTSMREHQKFFSLKNPATGRIEGFATVANRETADHGATILHGNQKVLSARLSDAAFFWENDLREAKVGMGAWAEGLKAVTFHNKLGSQSDRIARIAALAREIAPMVGADADLAQKAAEVAKLDLRSAMVGEFPELQGLMGMHYARVAGFPEEVALAARDHYSPLGPSDAVPSDPVSVAVALADKIDTLTGFWAIDEKPTGSKDPFALRRAALGVIRLVVGTRLSAPMLRVLRASIKQNVRAMLSAVKARKLHFEYSNIEIDYYFEEWRQPVFLQLFNWDGLLSSNLEALEYALRDFERNRFEDYDLVEQDGDAEAASHLRKLHSDADAILRVFRDRLRSAFESHLEIFRLGPYDEPPPNYYDRNPLWLHATGGKETDLLAFLHDRLKVFLRDQGIRHDIIDACLAMPGNDDLTLLVRRAEALNATLKTEDGANLIQGFKRANNIWTQAMKQEGYEDSDAFKKAISILNEAEAKDGVEYSYGADPKFAEDPAELALFAALDRAEAAIAPAMEAEDFTAAMQAMAALRAPIDAFFTAVQVNSQNPVVRRNRLNLLHRIRATCAQVADLAKIEG